MIEIKTTFQDWKTIDTETALRFVTAVRDGLTNIPDGDKDKYINENRLRGATVEELCRKAGMRESAE